MGTVDPATVMPRSNLGWLFGQWTASIDANYRWPGHTIDTTTVLEILAIARDRNDHAFLSIDQTVDEETIHNSSARTDETRLDDLADYELRRLRLVHPTLRLGPDALHAPLFEQGDQQTLTLIANHVAGAGRRRIHWRGLFAGWALLAVAGMAGSWVWAAATDAAARPILALLAVIIIVISAPLIHRFRQNFAEASKHMPGIYVEPSTRGQVRASRANRRRDLVAASVGGGITLAVTGAAALLFGK